MIFCIILGVLMALMIIGMAYFYLKIFPTYESHWKATEHELNVVWDHVNILECNENDEDQHGGIL